MERIRSPDVDYIKEGNGVDQLASIIEQIQIGRSRRLVMVDRSLSKREMASHYLSIL